MTSSTIHILGAGSIGLLLAYHLSKSGKDVVLIKRNNHLLRDNTLHYRQGDRTDSLPVMQVNASNIIHIDTLLICTKAYDTFHALSTIRQAINPKTTLILFQNGLGIQDQLLHQYPNNSIYTAVTFEAAKRTQSMHVTHTGVGKTQLGLLSSTYTNRTLFNKLACTLIIEQTTNIYPIIWKKLITNCCINPLTALYNCLNGQLLEIPDAVLTIEKIIKECLVVAHSQNIHLDYASVKTHCFNVIEVTAQNSSSMREDVKKDQATEIDFINGYITQKSKLLDVPTPINNSLYQQIKALEKH